MADDLYYGDASLRKQLFCAYAIVTTPVIYSTAAGTGGPLLWNGSVNVNAHIVRVGLALSTATSVAAAIGLTGATGQVAAPGSTTAITTVTNLYIGGPGPSCTPYMIGTPTNAGTFFIPLTQVTTAAVSVTNSPMTWFELNRMITVPPGSWISLAGSATMTNGVFQAGLVWEEIPSRQDKAV